MSSVVHKAKISRLRKEEREKFIGNFAQAKNLIDNQLKNGYHIKQVKKIKAENKKKADAVKVMKKEHQVAIPVQSKLYGF